MIHFLKTNKDSVCILLDRSGADEMIYAIESLSYSDILRVDINVDYSNLRKHIELTNTNRRKFSIAKAGDEFDELFSWSSSTITAILNEESLDYLYFKIKEFKDSGFVFPSGVLDVYSSNIKQPLNLSIMPLS